VARLSVLRGIDPAALWCRRIHLAGDNP
jgi:hypothetical protein